jgi:hypothetical protein
MRRHTFCSASTSFWPQLPKLLVGSIAESAGGCKVLAESACPEAFRIQHTVVLCMHLCYARTHQPSKTGKGVETCE